MTAQQGPKRKNLAATLKKETIAATEKANVEAKKALTRGKVKKRARLKPNEPTAKAQKALQAAQAKAKHERRARLKVEKALAEAREALAARLEVKQEPQIRVRRVSFVVRLTVDEHSQLGRTEIEHVESGRKQNFLSLDGERLVVFMKECVGPGVISEPAVSTAPSIVSPVEVMTPKPEDATRPRKTLPAPSGDAQPSTGARLAEQALALPPVAKRRHAEKKSTKHHRRKNPKPGAPQNTVFLDQRGDSSILVSKPRRPQASLIVFAIRVFLPEKPDLTTLAPLPEEPFIIQARFRLQGTEARSLTAQGHSYRMKIYANELTSGTSQLVATCSAELVQDALEYTAPAEVPGLPPGLYRIFTVVTLGPPIMIAGFHGKTIIHVI